MCADKSIAKNYVIEEIPINVKNSEKSDKKVAPILNETLYFINELSGAEITFPNFSINIIECLKKLTRTGKAVRLNGFESLGVKARTIYDHMLSVAYLADVLAGLDKEIKPDMYSNLGRIIAYHEINEVLLGDVPAYTNSNYLIGKVILNEGKFKNIDKIKRELISNQFIWLFLNDKQRESINELNEGLRHGSSDLMKVFRMLDSIDPIICIWRYLFFYRSKFNGMQENFIESMRDFFVYPKVLKYKTDKKLKNRFPYVAEMLEVLTSIDNAKRYATENKLNKLTSNKILTLLTYLIEQVPLFVKSDF